MNGKVIKIVQELNDLVVQDFDELQSYRDMATEWPLGEARNINGSIHQKIHQDSACMRFFSHFPPLSSMQLQWHDCPEICQILSGQLKDGKTGRVWNTNDIAIFSKGEKHIPQNPSPQHHLYLMVEFQRT